MHINLLRAPMHIVGSMGHGRALGVGLFAVLLMTLGCGSSQTTTNGGTTPNGTPTTTNGGGTSTTTGDGVTYEHVQRHWINNSDPAFPKTNFFLGYGTGASTDDADNAGRNQIAAFFETEIASQLKSYSEQILSFRNDAPANISESSFRQTSLQATVRQTVVGAKAEKRLQHEGIVHSLVVLDRRTFAENLKTQIEALKEKIRAGMQAAQSAATAGRHLQAMREFSRLVSIYDELIKLVQQYELGKPAGWPSISLDDVKLSDILAGLRQAAEQLTFAFRFEIKVNHRDGRAETRPQEDAEAVVIESYHEEGIQALVYRSSSAFLNTPLDDLRRLSAEQLGDLLQTKIVNYVVVGTLETEYYGFEDRRNAHLVRCKYRAQVWNVQAREMISLADAVGNVGASPNEREAHERAIRNAARSIGQALISRFGGE